MTHQPAAKFGEPTPLPMAAFHAINAATTCFAAATNDDLLTLVGLQPTWETLAPVSVTPHLLRRILSDDTAIQKLVEQRQALLVGIECVMLDHADELSGPDVDANLADLAHQYLAVAGSTAPAEIRDAIEAAEAGAAVCPRCGGDPCTECGECPRQGCWDCRCGQQDRDDEREQAEDA